MYNKTVSIAGITQSGDPHARTYNLMSVIGNTLVLTGEGDTHYMSNNVVTNGRVGQNKRIIAIDCSVRRVS